MADQLLLVISVLLLGFLATRLAGTLRLPHSVFLVLIGLLLGGGLPLFGFSPQGFLGDSFSDVILFILLPPLVFESAYSMHLSDLKKNFKPIVGLAVLGLLLSTFIIGGGIHLLFDIHLMPALVFGALISATDPVAVVALFKELGAPKRLATLIEGESLFNDGTAIVLFRVLVAATLASMEPTRIMTQGIKDFIFVAFGGMTVGLVVALLTSLCLRLTARFSSAQLGLTVMSAYFSFLIADHFFHVSGIFATLVVGLYLGHRARLEFNKEALHGMHSVWEFLALCANSIVFLSVGLAVDYSVLFKSITYIPATLTFVYIARALAVYSISFANNFFQWSAPISFSYQTICVWGGLRGGLAMALALMLPVNFPHRPLILALTTSVILSTLLINALSVRKLMSLLKVDRLDRFHEGLYHKALDFIRQDVFFPLVQAVSSGILSEKLVAKYQKKILQPLDKSPHPSVQLRFQFHQLLLDEKRYYEKHLEDGMLSKKAYLVLSKNVQERMDYIRHAKTFEEIINYEFDLIQDENKLVKILGQIFFQWYRQWKMKRSSVELEVLLHLDLAIYQSAHQMELGEVKEIGKAWAKKVKEQLKAFYSMHPELALTIQSKFILDMTAARARHNLEHLLGAEIIGSEVFMKADQKIQKIYNQWIKEAHEAFRPSISHWLKSTSLFSSFSDEELQKISEVTQVESYCSDEFIIKEGEMLDSFYLVLSGILEASGDFISEGKQHSRIFPGDFFGELSLVVHSKSHNSAEFFDVDKVEMVTANLVDIHGEVHLQKVGQGSIKAETDCEVLKINRKEFLELLDLHPEIMRSIAHLTEKRIA